LEDIINKIMEFKDLFNKDVHIDKELWARTARETKGMSTCELLIYCGKVMDEDEVNQINIHENNCKNSQSS